MTKTCVSSVAGLCELRCDWRTFAIAKVMQYSFYPLEGDIQLDIQSLQRLAHIPITNINDILSVHKWAGLVQSHASLLDMPITGL